MPFVVLLIIVFLFFHFRNKNKKNIKVKEPVAKPANPFEAYKKIKELREIERNGGEFDLRLYRKYKLEMEHPSSIKIAEDIINSKNVYEAFDWYNEQKGNGFYFKRETYDLIKDRINKEFCFDTLDLAECHKYLCLIKHSSQIYMSDELYSGALSRIYKFQEDKIYNEVLDLTIKKASKRIKSVSKDFHYFSPRLLRLKEELEKCDSEDDVILKEIAKLQTRISKCKDNPEKLNLLLTEQMKQRDTIKGIIQDKINLVSQENVDLDLKFEISDTNSEMVEKLEKIIEKELEKE